jgi:hypothetical protein
MTEILRNLETFRKADELMRICRSAVRNAQAESRRLGIANVYSFNGERYFELSNGDYSRTVKEQMGTNGA